LKMNDEQITYYALRADNKSFLKKNKAITEPTITKSDMALN